MCGSALNSDLKKHANIREEPYFCEMYSYLEFTCKHALERSQEIFQFFMPYRETNVYSCVVCGLPVP